MPLDEQQEIVAQISLLNKKLVHLEETLKIEEKEAQMQKNIEFHQKKNAEEAKLKARKEQERLAQEVQLEKEEAETRKVVQKMSDCDRSLTPITKCLAHFEGK